MWTSWRPRSQTRTKQRTREERRMACDRTFNTIADPEATDEASDSTRVLGSFPGMTAR